MPVLSVTQAGGTTPMIPASSTREELLLQNNSARDVYYRFYGQVHPSTEALRGVKLPKEGGSLVRLGAAAKLPVYLCHADGVGPTAQVTYETDVPI